MKFRDVVIFNGQPFSVPQGIQRIDTRATHGWQVRYGGTKLFSDHTPDGSGAKASLERAKQELARRIANMPAPSLLQKNPSESKTSDLPVGISGPIVRQRKGSRVRSCSFSVLLPRYGMAPRCSSVYIGTENTYTVERYHAALEKAAAMRREAEQVYELAATKAKRAAAKVLMAGGKLPAPTKSAGRQAAVPKATPKAAPKAAPKAVSKTTGKGRPVAVGKSVKPKVAPAKAAAQPAARGTAKPAAPLRTRAGAKPARTTNVAKTVGKAVTRPVSRSRRTAAA